MQVILKKDVQNVGEAGDIVNVKDGYARNFLIPQNVAEIATEGALRNREQNLARIKAKQEKLHQEALEIAQKIEALGQLELSAKAGETGKLFGTITTKKLAEELNAKLGTSIDRKIIAIDLREIDPIDGVIRLVGDITCETTAQQVIDLMEGARADLVMADGAPDTIGRIEYDEYVQHAIVRASLALATMILRPGGTFVSKIFRTRGIASVYSQLGCFFKEVLICKPRASRMSSVESFVVGRGFALPPGYEPTLVTGRMPTGPVPPVRFVQCGDVYGLDSERTYPLEGDERHV